MTAFLAFMCLLVGFLCGATSIGGILLIPAIQYCADMPAALASGTALCSFFFTSAWGTWLHGRRGSLQRSMVVPQCLGAVLFGCLGALAKAAVGS
ncbi:MAG: TSUP family transporter, partial [Mailhella sp.]|nr:TSUP family transporter [Mailhella sp.]